MLLPFQGATAPTHDTQGVATLALGYVLHWAFSPHLHTLFFYTQLVTRLFIVIRALFFHHEASAG